eukprot:15361438-Ditylum_brightwellii.AAC.1
MRYFLPRSLLLAIAISSHSTTAFTTSSPSFFHSTTTTSRRIPSSSTRLWDLSEWRDLMFENQPPALSKITVEDYQEGAIRE